MNMKINIVPKYTEPTRLNTQAEAIEAVKGSLYIVGSVDANGDFSFSPSPMSHYGATSARSECKRLAKCYPGKMFIFVELSGAEMVSVAPTISI